MRTKLTLNNAVIQSDRENKELKRNYLMHADNACNADNWALPSIHTCLSILGDPGADSGGEGKSERAEK